MKSELKIPTRQFVGSQITERSDNNSSPASKSGEGENRLSEKKGFEDS